MLLGAGLFGFAVGILFFAFVLQDLLQGGRGSYFGGASPLKWFWLLWPVSYLVMGAAFLLMALSGWKKSGLSPERTKIPQDAAPRPVDDAGAATLAPAPAEAEYPTVPAVRHDPGTDLAVRLSAGLAGGCGVALLLAAVLLCSGITPPLVVYAVSAIRAGSQPAGGIAAFFSLPAAGFWVVSVLAFVKEWRQWRLGYPVVEVSALPLYCGETYDLLVTVPGPASFRRLRVAVVCEEVARYTLGGEACQQVRRVYDRELARQEHLDVEAGGPLRVRGSLRVPPGAMHSFQAEHNEVRWVVRVEGEAQRLFALKFTHDYPLPVRPPRGYGGKQ
jgi:hypothetical protein